MAYRIPPQFERLPRLGVVASAGCALTLLMPFAANAQSSLDMTIDTGAIRPSSSAAPTASDNPSPSTPASRTITPLPSRGMPNYAAGLRQAAQTPAAAPQVLAQLGMVTANSVAIHLTRDRSARALSIVPKGTNLAVVADGGDWWGVLMVNNTMGWLPKSALQLMDYRTEISVPSAPTAASESSAASTGDVSAGYGAGSNLDARTSGLLKEAFSYLGVPYVWAGTSRSGLDCSGFLCNVFAGALGIHLPRHSGDQAKVGQPVPGDDLRPGDRLYFDMGNRGEISHCGIYLGNGYFIHASTNHGRVDVDSLLKTNYRRALVAARRS